MEEKNLILAAVGVLLFLIFLVQTLRSKSPVLNGLVSMFFGASSLVALNMLGFAVAVNLFTVLVSLTLGIPGVALMLITVHLI